MNARPADAPRRWIALHLAVLLLWSALSGCASVPAPPTLSPRRPRVLLASSNGSTTGGESSAQRPQRYNVPGRNPSSQAPWEFFLGNAAHRLIAYMYGVNHPRNQVFYNTWTIAGIVRRTDFADMSRLLQEEQQLRPDITDVTRRSVFEIKPWNPRGLQEGLEEVALYVVALNRACVLGRNFSAGVDFNGEILIRFAQGQYIWRLEWRTTEPGVVQYRWTRSQQRFESASEAADAGQWVELTQEELRQYGGWVGQAVDGMVDRREQLAALSGVVGVVIDVIGEGAKGMLTGAILGRMGSGSRAQPPGQPPAQGGAQIIPLRPAAPATTPPAQVPAAAMGF